MMIYLDHDDDLALPIGAKCSVGVVLVEAAQSTTARRWSQRPLCVELSFVMLTGKKNCCSSPIDTKRSARGAVNSGSSSDGR